ncbi:Predicted exonuclease of the beta-lactamase fold involved in RNA processing [Prochlorococcus marinus str. MIT 9515]|uniref:Predicted exonuclease of the beta-lactamase fold involved in RNA processing n=1 Tax=Prochlorococcus marinus (strain MIT 9515) TaxID=167542 RepID=A2BWA4_PROM5|nr:ligase-associated DNA damage response exonuclease [Prochlorococcus marinus]ABM72065.1 Predicted exonuclease of the beta-lactamase fold involved in RNA processing [Prochlorococcus marinus str. MIT 9515]
MREDSFHLIKYTSSGLYCEVADLWIDPKKPVKQAIITHAHMDHFTFGCEEYISTLETAIILKERIGKDINIRTYEYEKEFKVNGIKISFHPSGHILGSSQIKINMADEIWLITSDFKRQKDDTCKKYEIVKTDFLISESTFGLPIFNWDEPQNTALEIKKWIHTSHETTYFLFCYSLGKAQRLLNEISKLNFTNNIFTHSSIDKMNKCYKNFGVEIIETKKFENNKNIGDLKGSLILLPPALNRNSFLKRYKDFQTGFASGWMSIRALRKRSGYDKGFPISDHADWSGILKTIEESKAKNVFFHHGDSEVLIKYLKEKKSINVLEFEYKK